MNNITALVHTYNAERCLDEVLSALEGFDELLVCDMHSTDRTLEICAQHNARVIFHDLVGFVEPARNFAIQSAANRWVLIVDADEVVSPELAQYVRELVGRGAEFAALKIPVLEYFMGQPLRSSYPNFVVRLVDKGRCFWPETIHSKPQIEGVVLSIDKNRRDLALQHYSNPSVGWRIEKMNLYTSKEVERKAGKWKNRTLFFTGLSATIRFLKGYLIKGGCLDGKAGFAYASIEFIYKFIVLFKIWEYRKNNQGR